jgi:hypothetical protein
MYSAFGHSAQCDSTFGDQIHVLAGRIGHTVEQIVQADKVRAFDVPVGVFRLQLEIDRVGQAVVEQLHDAFP